MGLKKPRELTADEVRYRADLAPQGIKTSDDLSPALAIVGQSDALEALEMGLRIRQPGYNIFLAGMKGTGRFAAVREMVTQAVPPATTLRSYCYVFDFKDHDVPLLITLPAGMGREYQAAVERLRAALRDTVPAVLSSDVFTRSRQRLLAKADRESHELFGGFDRKVHRAGFAVVKTQGSEGPMQMADVFPVIKGEPMPFEQVRGDPREAGVGAAELQTIDKKRRAFKNELGLLVVKQRQISARYQKLIRDTEARKMAEAISPLFDEVRTRFAPFHDGVAKWIENTRDELLAHLESFREPDGKSPPPPPGTPRFDDFLGMLQVNLLWDPGVGGDNGTASPIVEENFPTWRNLFGSVEAAGDQPMATFQDIKAGSLLRADGGYILLSARDVLSEPRVYENLKRVLRKELLEIAPRDDGPGARFGIKPDPIPLQVKVVLIGEPEIYDMLFGNDPDFRKIFKIKCEFDDSMPLTQGNLDRFLSVLRRIVDESGLARFERTALETVVDEGVRLAGNRHRLTTQFSDVADVMRESAYLCEARGGKIVARKDVELALDMRRRRHDLVERRMRDLIRDGKVLVEVDGARVGQVNALGFYDLDYAQFGMPARISATCATGRSGVVNIEREAALSGRIHDKGVLILSGFIASTFAQDKPLSLHANIAFEQSYAFVDGDSASLAELIALLSALSNVPIRQDIAVTGSLNQRGGVQPVGGVTEKIQGFFRACAILGLTGDQGVILPAPNVSDLHLDEATTAALKKGRFHVYPVSNYTDALEILMERPAPEVLGLANKTLASYAEIVRDFQ